MTDLQNVRTLQCRLHDELCEGSASEQRPDRRSRARDHPFIQVAESARALYALGADSADQGAYWGIGVLGG
jgi:hypothetical protein